jgi:RNA 3'-terminal phosphate cyclase-like protein
LVAESTEQCLGAAELSAEGGILPEELGKKVAELLLEEISMGGCVDSRHQSMALLLMLLCPEDVSKVRLGKLTPHTIACLRLYKEVFGVMFKIKPDKAQGNNDSDAHTVLLSCLGIGYTNFARQTI